VRWTGSGPSELAKVLPEPAFEILGQVMTDRDSDVKKGVAWMLRDLSKHHAARVFKFLLGRAQSDPNRDTVWIIKNGMKKLPADQQQQLVKALEQ